MKTEGKKTVKIAFCDFWQGCEFDNLHFIRILEKKYNLVYTNEPDYLFCSCFGKEHFKYKDCIKIFYTGENCVCDFNLYDYGLTSHYMTITDRHLRFPQWIPSDLSQISLMEFNREKNPNLNKKKFCNFVYSNTHCAEQFREVFFEKLSKYKKVDSGGGILNNLGYKVQNKLDFIKNYKFTIAIENSFVQGYTTEKLSEPLIMGSMPIYYGDPMVNKEFNTNSFVNLRDFKSIDEAVEYIVELDKNDKLYLEKLQNPCFIHTNVEKYYRNKTIDFFSNIFDHKKEEAKRTTQYGWTKYYIEAITPPPIATKNSKLQKIKEKKKKIFSKENI